MHPCRVWKQQVDSQHEFRKRGMSALMRGGGGPPPHTLGEMYHAHSLFPDSSRQASSFRPRPLSCPPPRSTLSHARWRGNAIYLEPARGIWRCTKSGCCFSSQPRGHRVSRRFTPPPVPLSGVMRAIHALFTELTREPRPSVVASGGECVWELGRERVIEAQDASPFL